MGEDMAEKKKRVGMIGGGEASFMGPIHRAAIEQSGCVELVCGAFGSTRQSSFETGRMLNLPPRRSYGTYRDLFRREASFPKTERIDFVTVLTPNAMHYPIAMSSIDASFPIFSEKPFTCNLDEAVNLTRKLRNSGLAYGVAMVYPCYPALRKAQDLIQKDKAIGVVRKVVATFSLGWMAQRLETAGNKQAGWRTDPRRSGPAGCLADLGSHAFYLSEWLTGLSVSEVCADLRPTVAGRILDDDCTLLVRFETGARGVFLCSQIATGRQEGLAIEIYGDKAALGWSQSRPGRLTLTAIDGQREELTVNGSDEEEPLQTPPSPYGNNRAYIAALAECYRSFAATLDRPKGQKTEPLPLYMSVEEGLRSVAFVDAVLQNTAVPEEDQPLPAKWMPVVVPPVLDL
jgi:predicted dehydrogenase